MRLPTKAHIDRSEHRQDSGVPVTSEALGDIESRYKISDCNTALSPTYYPIHRPLIPTIRDDCLLYKASTSTVIALAFVVAIGMAGSSF